MGSHRMRTPLTARLRRRATRTGLIAGITTFLLLAGTGVSYAAWTAGAAATSTASAANLSLTTSNFTTNAYTFQNHQLRTTGSVTIANTTDTNSGTVATLDLTLGLQSGNASLASNLQVRVWPSTLGACVSGTTTPGTATPGTWSSFPALSTPLAKGSSVTYCIRTFGAERGDLANSTGSATITPRVTATLTVGNFTASASTTTTQGTSYIYPTPAAFDEYAWYYIKSTTSGTPCLDVYSNGTSSGTALIEYGCKSVSEGNLNQQWRLTKSSGNYYDVQPRNATDLRWDNGASAAEGVPINVNTDAAGAGQEWQLQQVSTGVYQIVNNFSGLCLKPLNTALTTSVEYSQGVCDGTAGQRFTLTVAESIPHLDSIGCANSGTSGTNRRVTYTWSPQSTESYSIQYRASGSTGAWTAIATVGAGVSSYTWTTGAGTPSSVGVYDVRVVAGTSTAAATPALAVESVWRGADGSGAYLRCAPPTAAIASLSCADTGGTGTSRRVQYSWSPASTEPYSIQYRALGSTGAWTLISTIDPGVSSFTWSSGNPATDGTYDVRVVVGTSVAAATPSLAVNSVWKGTGAGPSVYLRCVQPTPAIATIACTDTGTSATNYRISYSWGEEAVKTYTLQLQNTSGVWADFGTVTPGGTSVTVNPAAGTVPLTWSVGTYNARIVDGTTVLASTTFYRGGTTTPYLRCSEPPLAVAMSCTGSWGTVTLTWAQQPAGTYRLQARNSSNADWLTLATTTSRTSVSIGTGDISGLSTGEKDLQLLNSANTVVATGALSIKWLLINYPDCVG